MRSTPPQSPGPSEGRAAAPSRCRRASRRRPGPWCPSMAEVALAGEDHREMMTIRRLDRHLVTDRAAGLDDRGDAGLSRELDPIGEWEVGVAGHDRGLGPVA